MSDNTYRTVTGFVYAGPFPRKAGSRDVRDYYVSVPNPLVNDKGEVTTTADTKVRVTVWDSHAGTDINAGDYIAANGKFEIYEGQNKDGDYVKSYSVSANKLKNFGSGLGDGSDRGLENVVKTDGKPKRNYDDIPGL